MFLTGAARLWTATVGFFMAEASAIETALQTAFNTMKTDVIGYITVILPIALGIVGAVFAIRWAVKFFKGVANK